LHYRNRTGEGQHVDVALVDGIWFQSNGFLTAGAMDMPITKMANQFSIAAPVNVYGCKGGQIYGGVLLDSHWVSFCKLMKRDDIAHYKSLERINRRDEVDSVVKNWCAERTVEEVVDSMLGIGLTVTKVNTFSEVSTDENVGARDMLQETTLSDGSVVPLTGPTAKFSRTPTKIRNPAPTLGQDNLEIYGELGLSKEDIEKLRNDSIV